ncbi:hypothetical protein BOTBODRAFT_180874 [Botryobasidium botryosum FD-172 SS1]|uniref:Uncharacterized protein n=1 Tax=Botryobasidium botryosum (strain FD-172 SS1) TaxID=930990 RepID=A0A067LVU4_BOTB1|nr:hypothetical protein BOTBODRAFT_180874 [Botryobasidium botryosum FD-172 SS1]
MAVNNTLEKNQREAWLQDALKSIQSQNSDKGTHQTHAKAYVKMQYLTPEQETVLLDWGHHLGWMGIALAREGVRAKAADIKGDHALPSKNWFKCFVGCHSDTLSFKKASGLDPKQAKGFNHPTVEAYLAELSGLHPEHLRIPTSSLFTGLIPEALLVASGIAVVEHINRLLAPSHFQLKGCAWSPFGNFIATPHLSEDVAKLPEVLPRILLDMFKVEFRHLTFDNSSFVVVYNLPLGPPGNWADPSTIALALMAQNNILEPLPASPGRWLANPDRHKGTTASLRLSLSPLMKAAILRSGTLFFDGRPHPVRAFTAAKTKPNQCRQCWRLGHSEAWCRQTNPVCGTCAQGHPSHHHHAVAPNAAQLCVLCKGAHPSWTRWCVNRHIQLAAQPPLPKKKPAKPSAASKRHASKVTAGSSTNVPSSTTEPSGDIVTHL